MDFRWRVNDLAAPDVSDADFKWRFASEMLKPKLQIEGPGVGSLLYAMNPATSELGLKQMDSELNQQLAANENFDKRGDEAMKFMEKRVAEDIAGKEFADKMALEQQKIQNVDAGHANSLLANYTQAIQSGDATAIAIAEDRIRKTFPNADAIINDAKSKVGEGKVQEEKYWELESRIPGKWDKRAEQTNYIKDVEQAMREGKINSKQGSDLRSKAMKTDDWETINKHTMKQAYATNAASKSVGKTNAQNKNKIMMNYAANNGLDLSKPTDRAKVENWYKLNYEG